MYVSDAMETGTVQVGTAWAWGGSLGVWGWEVGVGMYASGAMETGTMKVGRRR